MKLLFIGDIVGNSGMEMLEKYLPQLKHDLKPQITVVNGENSTSQGRGISEKNFKKIMSLGADTVTLGNHAWNNAEIFDFIDNTKKLIRPLNFPGKNVPGRGYTILNVNSEKVAIINLQGRIFLDPIDDPFSKVDDLLAKIKNENVKYIFIDFHAETTSEKKAMALYLDGRISAIVGTHTHVQTNDNQVLKNGTGFLTEVGMTGPDDGVIGMQYSNVIHKFLTQRPSRFNVEENGNNILSGCLIDMDKDGFTKKIDKILISNSKPYNVL